jgi:hypothetical protein
MNEMDERIRRQAGRLPASSHPAVTITDSDDRFAIAAKRAGVVPDLVAAVRGVIPNAAELQGAALQSALAAAIEARPSLRVPGSAPRIPEGLDGGAGRGPRERAEPDMDELIRRRTGRISDVPRFANGIPEHS